MADVVSFPKSVATPQEHAWKQAEKFPSVREKIKAGFVFEALHCYEDAAGVAQFWRIRLKHPETGAKFIRPFSQNAGVWALAEPSFPNGRPLYGIRRVAQMPSGTVWVCEGEWAVDKLQQKFDQFEGNNRLAVTSGSATSASKADWGPLAGRNVVIWPDKDEAGLRYAASVTKILKPLGCSVEWIDVDKLGIDVGGDAVNWLDSTPKIYDSSFVILPKTAPLTIPTAEEAGRPLIDFLMSEKELAAAKVPEREMIVEPFIPTQSLSMVFAARGVGKTWFGIQLAYCVAVGNDLFGWKVPKARRVLYIDGENPLSVIQYRLRVVCHEATELLNILPSDILWREDVPLNLSDPAQQERIDTLLAQLKEDGQSPELLILDNLSSLAAGIEENSNSDLDTLLRWLIKLRSQGYAVVVVHHAGKNGEQRGASRREDLLDTSIKLTEREPSKMTSGACFEIEFTKLRGARPDPDRLIVELDTHGSIATWICAGAQMVPKWLTTLRVIRDEKPKTQKALAKSLKITPSAVSQQLKSARKAGMLQANSLKLTEEGLKKVNETWPVPATDF
jgi:KaiC/GvpD/RAD55 family RecA-like ATPase